VYFQDSGDNLFMLAAKMKAWKILDFMLAESAQHFIENNDGNTVFHILANMANQEQNGNIKNDIYIYLSKCLSKLSLTYVDEKECNSILNHANHDRKTLPDLLPEDANNIATKETCRIITYNNQVIARDEEMGGEEYIIHLPPNLATLGQQALAEEGGY